MRRPISAMKSQPQTCRSRRCQRLHIIFIAAASLRLIATSGEQPATNGIGTPPDRLTSGGSPQDVRAEWDAAERRLVQSAFQRVPYLREFASQFPTNVQFTDLDLKAAPKGESEQHQWTIQTGLYGRHLLRMEIPFRIDRMRTNVLGFDQPRIALITFDKVPERSWPLPLSQMRLAESDWKKLVASRGDLAAISFRGWTNRPIAMFEEQWWNWTGEHSVPTELGVRSSVHWIHVNTYRPRRSILYR